MACTREQIREEVWGQLVDHLNDGGSDVLDESNVVAWFLDPAIEFPNPSAATNLEPLLVNTAGSWDDRPTRDDADPQPLPRVGLRPHPHRPGDDGGRERGGASRGQRDPRPHRILGAALRRLEAREPAIFAPARLVDRLRWRLGRRAARPPVRVTDAGDVAPRGVLGRAMMSRPAAALARRGGR